MKENLKRNVEETSIGVADVQKPHNSVLLDPKVPQTAIFSA